MKNMVEPVHIRQGINLGKVCEYSEIKDAIGEPINKCQRIMDCGEADHILISSTFKDAIIGTRSPSDKCIPLGLLYVKHRDKVEVYSYYDKEKEIGKNSCPKKSHLFLPSLKDFCCDGSWRDLLSDCEIVDLSHGITNELPCTFNSQDYKPITVDVRLGQGNGINFHTTMIDNFYMNHSTHIDFPKHLEEISAGQAVGEYNLQKFVCEVVVFDATNIAEAFRNTLKEHIKNNLLCTKEKDEYFKILFDAIEKLKITKDMFVNQLGDRIENKSVIIYTGLDKYWTFGAKTAWEYMYFFNPYIGEDLADFFVEKEISLLGIDALQIENPIINFDKDCPYLTSSAKTYIEEKLEYVRNHFIHKILLSKEIMLIENMTNVGKLVGKKSLLIAAPIKIVLKTCADNSITRAFAIVLKEKN
jgi:kynurenine formamidase